MTAAMLLFTEQTCPIYFASREVVEWRGRECERWVVITLQPDGQSSWHAPIKTRADAEGIAVVLADGEAKQRWEARDLAQANPMMDAIMKLPSHHRGMMIDVLWRQFGHEPTSRA